MPPKASRASESRLYIGVIDTARLAGLVAIKKGGWLCAFTAARLFIRKKPGNQQASYAPFGVSQANTARL